MLHLICVTQYDDLNGDKLLLDYERRGGGGGGGGGGGFEWIHLSL